MLAQRVQRRRREDLSDVGPAAIAVISQLCSVPGPDICAEDFEGKEQAMRRR